MKRLWSLSMVVIFLALAAAAVAAPAAPPLYHQVVGGRRGLRGLGYTPCGHPGRGKRGKCYGSRPAQSLEKHV